MCDCYGHRCECCEELVPMHIANFKFPRSNFRVWCNDHIDNAPSEARLFELLEKDDHNDLPIGWKCAILGPEVGCDKGNLPNTSAEMKYKEMCQ